MPRYNPPQEGYKPLKPRSWLKTHGEIKSTEDSKKERKDLANLQQLLDKTPRENAPPAKERAPFSVIPEPDKPTLEELATVMEKLGTEIPQQLDEDTLAEFVRLAKKFGYPKDDIGRLVNSPAYAYVMLERAGLLETKTRAPEAPTLPEKQDFNITAEEERGFNALFGDEDYSPTDDALKKLSELDLSPEVVSQLSSLEKYTLLRRAGMIEDPTPEKVQRKLTGKLDLFPPGRPMPPEVGEKTEKFLRETYGKDMDSRPDIDLEKIMLAPDKGAFTKAELRAMGSLRALAFAVAKGWIEPLAKKSTPVKPEEKDDSKKVEPKPAAKPEYRSLLWRTLPEPKFDKKRQNYLTETYGPLPLTDEQRNRLNKMMDRVGYNQTEIHAMGQVGMLHIADEKKMIRVLPNGPATNKQIAIPKEWKTWSEPEEPIKNSPEAVTDKPATPKVSEPVTSPKPTVSPEKVRNPKFKEYIVTAPDGEQVIITD